VQASELADPTPYLDGGELLLSVGMWLDPAVGAAALNEQAAAYLRRLVEVGVVGFGFGLGVGVQHAEVPSALVTAADSVGLDAAGTVQHSAGRRRAPRGLAGDRAGHLRAFPNSAVGVDLRFRLWVRTRSFTVLPALVGVWCG
jgi:hypothetical protein